MKLYFICINISLILINYLKETVFEVIAKLVNQRWIHQVIGSMISGYLCGQQWNRRLEVCYVNFSLILSIIDLPHL